MCSVVRCIDYRLTDPCNHALSWMDMILILNNLWQWMKAVNGITWDIVEFTIQGIWVHEFGYDWEELDDED